MIHGLGRIVSFSLFTHAFHAERSVQGTALEDGAAVHEEGLSKESSLELTTNSQARGMVGSELTLPSEVKTNARSANSARHRNWRQNITIAVEDLAES